MKKILMGLILSFPLTIFSSTLVILECELLEGGTIEDVKRINSAWVESVNKLNDKKVSSQVLEAVLSDNTEGFMYIDSYEDSIHWGQIRYEIKNGSIKILMNNLIQFLNAQLEKCMMPSKVNYSGSLQ